MSEPLSPRECLPGQSHNIGSEIYTEAGGPSEAKGMRFMKKIIATLVAATILASVSVGPSLEANAAVVGRTTGPANASQSPSSMHTGNGLAKPCTLKTVPGGPNRNGGKPFPPTVICT